MNKEFYAENRKSLYQKLEADMHRSRPMMRIIRFLQIVTSCI